MEKSIKEIELLKYQKLVLATLDYYIENPKFHIVHEEYNSKDHYENLKIIAQENFEKGKLTLLKNWFRDLTEMFIETREFKFNDFLQEKTSIEINIFDSFYARIEKILSSGKIKSLGQYYDVKNILDELIQSENPDYEKIKKLNICTIQYEKRNKPLA